MYRIRLVFAFVIYFSLLLSPAILFSQTLVKDINTTTTAVSSTPYGLVDVSGTVFFIGQEATTGIELWKSDGTAAGTVMVKDINPGSNSSMSLSTSKALLFAIGSTVYFNASDGVHGTELWKSDGTLAGTVMVKDINPGNGSSGTSVSKFTNMGGNLYFFATDGSSGFELFRSDGTSAGTYQVKDINPGINSSIVNCGCLPDQWPIAVLGSLIIFPADDGTHGNEPWASDGTAAGTILLGDLVTGSSGSSSTSMSTSNGKVYWGSSGSDVYSSDGTVAGTTKIKTINAIVGASAMGDWQNLGGAKTYFYGQDNNGVELWETDGTAAGTVMTKDINPGVSSGGPVGNGFTIGQYPVLGGKLIFRATDANGSELWSSDGTAAGTALLKDINPGASSSTPQNFTLVGTTLYFIATDGTNGIELWKTDGTAVGTVLVKDIAAGAASSSITSPISVSGTTLFFAANDGTNGIELWKSDGTAAGTVMIKDVNAQINAATPTSFKYFGTSTYLSANDGTNGTEFWSTDGTSAGTTMIKDINPGATASTPSAVNNSIPGKMIFAATTAANGRELWTSDGTTAGTALVKDINGVVGSSVNFSVFPTINGGTTVYFNANNGAAANGAELWQSDGTAAGTTLLDDILAGTSSSNPSGFLNIGTSLYFTATDANGTELWKTDGTLAGTGMVKDIYAGATSSSPSALTNLSGFLLFFANDGTNGIELWKSDGTAAGTALLKDINTGAGNSYVSATVTLPVMSGSNMFFVVDDGTDGQEIWKTDGTSAGTVLLKDIYPGTIPFPPSNLIDVGGTLFFTAYDDTNGQELWKSDGTSAGTVIVKDIFPGASNSAPQNFASSGCTLFFAATSSSNNMELWQSDGTSAGTTQLAEINSTGSSTPNALAFANGTLYFGADDGSIGRELWKHTPPVCPVPAPVEWLEFKGEVSKKLNTLFWSTASETNCDHFEVERMNSSGVFSSIGSVRGSGTVSRISNYSFIDSFPICQSYYRLKQVDFDNKFDHSKIILISRSENNISVELFPNPITLQETLYINLSMENINTETSIELHDMLGNLLLSKQIIVDQTHFTIPIDLDKDLSAGIYTISIVNSQQSVNRKLAIK